MTPSIAELTAPSVETGSITTPWLQEFREDAARRFEQLDWPRRTDETWRFANLKLSQMDRFDPEVQTPVVEAPAGIEVIPLHQLPFERIRPLLPALRGTLGAEKYLALAHSGPINGICILAPNGVNADEPIHILRQSNHHSQASLTLILSETNSALTVFERIQSDGESECAVIGNTVISAGPNSQVCYVLSQELGPKDRHVHASHLTVGRDARVQTLTGNFGAQWARQESVTEMAAPGGECEVLALNLLCDDQEIDQRTLQHHAQGRCHSNLLYKNALFDRSRSIFAGLIQVDEGAHQTDAFQSCRNLLLSEEAEANSLPGLEINADQVRCSHGATTGQIDPEEMFYLKARGITDDRARRLITLGFAHDVVQHLRHEGIREELMSLVESRLR